MTVLLATGQVRVDFPDFGLVWEIRREGMKVDFLKAAVRALACFIEGRRG